jgi:glycosyltransferase involved in cell wall biosynthesis
MKIALISNETKNIFPHYGNGGTQSCVENLAEGLYKKNHNFFVVCPKREIKKDYPFKIIEVDFHPKEANIKNDKNYSDLVNKIIEQESPDLALTQQEEILNEENLSKTKLITTRHDSGDKHRELLNKKNLKYRFISENQFKTWVKTEEDINNSFWCYTGFSDNEYEFNQFPEDYYLWVGSFSWGWEAKGLNLFIELAKYFKEKDFVIYGCGRPDIEKIVIDFTKELKNLNYGGMLKRGEDHRRVFKNAKTLIQLSNMNEAYGRTSVEALTKGTPVITNFNGANPEIVGNNGGIRVKTSEELFKSIDDIKNIDRKAVFDYSKRFHADVEVENLLNPNIW